MCSAKVRLLMLALLLTISAYSCDFGAIAEYWGIGQHVPSVLPTAQPSAQATSADKTSNSYMGPDCNGNDAPCAYTSGMVPIRMLTDPLSYWHPKLCQRWYNPKIKATFKWCVEHDITLAWWEQPSAQATQ